jgi:hypothetical protein
MTRQAQGLQVAFSPPPNKRQSGICLWFADLTDKQFKSLSSRDIQARGTRQIIRMAGDNILPAHLEEAVETWSN